MAFAHFLRRAVNQSFKWYFEHNYRRIAQYINQPHTVQQSILKNLLETSIHTEFGRNHQFNSRTGLVEFLERVPISDSESLKQDIARMMHGERDILCSGQVPPRKRMPWFG